MSATMTLPALMTQTTAYLLLHDAQESLAGVLVEHSECGDCKASGTGWCEPCNGLRLAAEEVGRAKALVKDSLSDRDARETVGWLIDLLSDKGRYGDAGEVAFFGVASERAA
jgi:hypothetical protein